MNNYLFIFSCYIVILNFCYVLSTVPPTDSNVGGETHKPINVHENIMEKLNEQTQKANEVCQWNIYKEKQPELENLLHDMQLPYINVPVTKEVSTSSSYEPKLIQYKKHFYVLLSTEADIRNNIPYYLSIDLYNEIQHALLTFNMEFGFWENIYTTDTCQKIGTFYGNSMYDMKTDLTLCTDHREGKRHMIIYQDSGDNSILPLKIDNINLKTLFMDSKHLINHIYLLAQKRCGYF